MQISISITADSLKDSELEKLMEPFSYELAEPSTEVLTAKELKEKVWSHIEKALKNVESGVYETDVYSIVIINPDQFFGRRVDKPNFH